MADEGFKEAGLWPIPLGQIFEELREGVVLFSNGSDLSQIQVVFFNSAALRILGEDSALSSRVPLPQVFREPECMKWIWSGPNDEYSLERKYALIAKANLIF
jgi:PAS domain-containing protein